VEYFQYKWSKSDELGRKNKLRRCVTCDSTNSCKSSKQLWKACIRNWKRTCFYETFTKSR